MSAAVTLFENEELQGSFFLREGYDIIFFWWSTEEL